MEREVCINKRVSKYSKLLAVDFLMLQIQICFSLYIFQTFSNDYYFLGLKKKVSLQHYFGCILSYLSSQIACLGSVPKLPP